MIDRLKAVGREPRFHGNGFVQLYISPNQRLHVWHPQLPPLRAHNATVHDHIWDMESDVLMGLLIHKEFDLYPHPSGELRVFEVDQKAVRANSGQFYIPSDETAWLVQTGEYRMAAGSSYTFEAHEFHSSEGDGLTATILTKGEDIYLRPRIIAPKNEKPVNAFDPSLVPSVEAMWRAIADALDQMPSAGWRKLHSILPSFS